MSEMTGYFIKKIGNHRGKPRVWLDRLQTEKAGFKPGASYDVVIQGQTIVLRANEDGSRVVTPKRDGDKVNPIIDLQSDELKALFDGMSAVRVAVRKGEIYLLPLATELKKQDRVRRLRAKLESGEPLSIGSVSHGGGIMAHAIHEGLKAAGVSAKLEFVNEIREELVEHASTHNDVWSKDTKIFNAPMQEVAFDQKALSHIPRTEIAELGLPCQAAAPSGRAKKGLDKPEADPMYGHLVVSALIILNQSNPALIVLENVEPWRSSASADILRTQLKELGYNISERVFTGAEWGAMENRTRWFMCATTEGIEFDFATLMPPELRPLKVKDILDPGIAPDDERWRPFAYLRDKEVTDLAQGKGFRMQFVREDDELVPTLRKGYKKGGSTDPLLINPDNPDLFRLFTAEEHARIKGIPIHLVADASETLAHEVLGQSVLYNNVKDIGEHIGNSLNRFVGKAESKPSQGRAAAEVIKSGAGVPEEIADLASEVVTTIRAADSLKGRYSGPIVAVRGDVLIQETGRREGVFHLKANLEEAPMLGRSVRIAYEQGRGKVQERGAAQMGLGI